MTTIKNKKIGAIGQRRDGSLYAIIDNKLIELGTSPALSKKLIEKFASISLAYRTNSYGIAHAITFS